MSMQSGLDRSMANMRQWDSYVQVLEGSCCNVQFCSRLANSKRVTLYAHIPVCKHVLPRLNHPWLLCRNLLPSPSLTALTFWDVCLLPTTHRIDLL